ncbi:ribonuclease Z [Chryseosolibacter indicus]|uniref:Ribonuclease Z n=1 Tax=Chryseosolibacter indicus TaxID=2782351 RepID=A0ABS5VSG3_9BACT|nr:ribonuclease Z [Chryseosolibacter indicus]MBT1703714.1 ribonuclease Z [Chryseosolibacter indicus]
MSFKITILGSSGALPAYGRFPSAQLVEIQNKHFLIDCGEGAQMQLMKFQANLHRINHIFITHLHGDHYLGLMGLIFTMHLLRRTNDLHIYSHHGLDEIITTHFRYSQSSPNFKIIFHTLEKDEHKVIYEDDALTVETVPLVHKLTCSGFIFREKEKPRRIDKEKLPTGLLIQQIANLKRGHDVIDVEGNILYKNADLTLPPRKSRSYAYCSDTAYEEKLVGHLKGIDVLYHEATFGSDEVQKAIETQHSTAQQAATIAKKAEVNSLILGHFSARYRELDPLLIEAKSVFPNVQLAIEGSTFTIED